MNFQSNLKELGRICGAGGTHTPKEDDNTLVSYANGQILDLICEGEIEGPFHKDNPLLDIYLDSIQIQNSDGTYNYGGVSGIILEGSKDQNFWQESLDYFGETFNTSVEYPKETEVTHDLENGVTVEAGVGIYANRLIVNISIPALYLQTDKGDTKKSSVSIKVVIKSLSLDNYYSVTKDVTIDGKNTSEYMRAIGINIPDDYITNLGWRVTVFRTTEDSTTSSLVNATWFNGVTVVSDDKLKYQNCAMAAVIADSRYFSSIPARAYDLMLKKVKVPSNYTPTQYYRDNGDKDGELKSSAIYNGDWDGTFKDEEVWTDNPAWVFWDLITNERYGLGDKIQEDQRNFVKWELYQISQYCDQIATGRYLSGVSNSTTISNSSEYYYDVKEPLFTCNAYIQTRKDAYDFLKDFTSCFRSLLYYGLGGIHVVQDAYINSDQPSLHQFTNANVVDGKFEYMGSSLTSRYTVVKIYWTDVEDNARRKLEYVEDAEGILQFGIIEYELDAFGCTSRSQARRYGEWLLWTNKNETEVCMFSVGLEGHSIRLGEVVDVLDNDRAGLKRGGRIISVDRTNAQQSAGGQVIAYLDRPIEIRKDLTSDYKPNFQFTVARNLEGSNPGYVNRASQIYTYNLTNSWYAANGFNQEGEVKKLQKIIFPVTSSYNLLETEENLFGYQFCLGMIWIYSSPELSSAKFKVLGITEASNGAEFLITSSPYNPEKYGMDGQKITYLPSAPTSSLPNQNRLVAPTITELSRRRRYISSTDSYEYIDSIDVSWKMSNAQSLSLFPNVAGFKCYIYVDGLLWKSISVSDIGQNFKYSFDFTQYGVTYSVKVAAIYKYGSQESPSELKSIYIDEQTIDEVPSVRGLYLVNNILDATSPQDYDEKNARIFYGADAIFAWNEANVNVTPEAGETDENGADTVLEEASKQNYAIRVYDPKYPDTDQYINEYYSSKNEWTYTFENNKNDGLRRDFIVNVAFQNSDGARGLSESLEVENDPPSAPNSEDLIFSYDKLGFNLKYSSVYSDRDYVASLLIITPSDVDNNLENLFKEWNTEANVVSGLQKLIKDNPKSAIIFKNEIYVSPFSLPGNVRADNAEDEDTSLKNAFQFIIIPFDQFAVGGNITVDSIKASNLELLGLNRSAIYTTSRESLYTNYFVDPGSINQSMLVDTLKKEIDLISADETIYNSVNYRLNLLSGFTVANDFSIRYDYQKAVELSKANGLIIREPIRESYTKYSSSEFNGWAAKAVLTKVPNQVIIDDYNKSEIEAENYSDKIIGPTNPQLYTGIVYDSVLKSWTNGLVTHYLENGDIWVDTTSPKYIDGTAGTNLIRSYKWIGNFSTQSAWDAADKTVCYWSLIKDTEIEVNSVALSEEIKLRNEADGLLGGEYAVKIQVTDAGTTYIAGFGLSNYQISSNKKLLYKRYLDIDYLGRLIGSPTDEQILAAAPTEGFYSDIEYYVYSDSIYDSEMSVARNIAYKTVIKDGIMGADDYTVETWYITDFGAVTSLYATNPGDGFRQINGGNLYIRQDIEGYKYTIKGSDLDPKYGTSDGRELWSLADGSEFIVAADRFLIINPNSDKSEAVFYVDTRENRVYMNNAYIKNLEADKISAGYLEAGLLVLTTVSPDDIVRTDMDIDWDIDVIKFLENNPASSVEIKNSQIVWAKNSFFESSEINTVNGQEAYQYIGENSLYITSENYVLYNPVNLLYKKEDNSFTYGADFAVEKLINLWKPLTSEIRSSNYRKDGEEGFIIRSDGYAEFNNIRINAHGTFKGEIDASNAVFKGNGFEASNDDVLNLGASLKIYLDKNFEKSDNEAVNGYDADYASDGYTFAGLLRSRNLLWNFDPTIKLLTKSNAPVVEDSNKYQQNHNLDDEVLSIQDSRLWVGREKWDNAKESTFAVDEYGAAFINNKNSTFKGNIYLNDNLNNIIFPLDKDWGDLVGIKMYTQEIDYGTHAGNNVKFEFKHGQNKFPDLVKIYVKYVGDTTLSKNGFELKKNQVMSAEFLGTWNDNEDNYPCWTYAFDATYINVYCSQKDPWNVPRATMPKIDIDLRNYRDKLKVIVKAVFFNF